jgi:hypothetical protein
VLLSLYDYSSHSAARFSVFLRRLRAFILNLPWIPSIISHFLLTPIFQPCSTAVTHIRGSLTRTCRQSKNYGFPYFYFTCLARQSNKHPPITRKIPNFRLHFLMCYGCYGQTKHLISMYRFHVNSREHQEYFNWFTYDARMMLWIKYNPKLLPSLL